MSFLFVDLLFARDLPLYSGILAFPQGNYSWKKALATWSRDQFPSQPLNAAAFRHFIKVLELNLNLCLYTTCNLATPFLGILSVDLPPYFSYRVSRE